MKPESGDYTSDSVHFITGWIFVIVLKSDLWLYSVIKKSCHFHKSKQKLHETVAKCHISNWEYWFDNIEKLNLASQLWLPLSGFYLASNISWSLPRFPGIKGETQVAREARLWLNKLGGARCCHFVDYVTAPPFLAWPNFSFIADVCCCSNF